MEQWKRADYTGASLLAQWKKLGEFVVLLEDFS
jgi:hypothetical protein